MDGLLFAFWCIPYRLPDLPLPAWGWWQIAWANRYTYTLLALWVRVLAQVRLESKSTSDPKTLPA
jgi:hypothetical protein